MAISCGREAAHDLARHAEDERVGNRLALGHQGALPDEAILPVTALLTMIAPMPTSEFSRMVQPWSITRGPMLTFFSSTTLDAGRRLRIGKDRTFNAGFATLQRPRPPLRKVGFSRLPSGIGSR